MSAKVAQTFTFSTYAASTNSLTPFLYQTRTLSDISWSRVSRHRYRGIYLQRPFSSIPRRRYAIDQNKVPRSTSTSASTTTQWSPVRSATDSGAAESQEFDASTRLDDRREWKDENMNTRSLDNSYRRNPASSRRDERATHQRYKGANEDEFSDFAEEKSIDFDEEMDEDYLANKDEIADLTRSHPLGESTITDSERYAFQKVFRDIFGKNQDSSIGIDDGFGSVLPPKEVEKAKIKQDKALSAASRSSMSRLVMEDMVNRYPAPLRAAAARAIGLAEAEAEGEEEALEDEPELDMEKVEMLRQPERDRVEALMKAAKTDFKLWEVMETEVFSLIPRLGLQDVAKPAQQLKKTKSRSKNPKEVKDKVETSPAPEESAHLNSFSVNENGISPLALYGPLYPSYLLLGLRLLDRSFAKSSPLTLTLLPKIKSYGLISHVLGASSQLYNELLQIHRYRYDDYRGILQLLEEMEHSGIEFDHETLDIVQDIQRTQASVRKGEKGPVLQTLWSLPEFAPNKFKAWYDKIGGDIRSRTLAQRTTLRY